jgi:hypothetical protein
MSDLLWTGDPRARSVRRATKPFQAFDLPKQPFKGVPQPSLILLPFRNVPKGVPHAA